MEIENLAGIDENTAKKNGIPVIGYMVAFTFGECAVPNDIVLDYWETNKLDADSRPNPTQKKGAFKKACSYLNGHKEDEYELDGFKYYSVYSVTRLTDTVYMITRKLIRVSVDEVETELEHINLMKVVFYKEDKTIDYMLEDSRMGKVAKELFENTIVPKYNLFLTHMTRDNFHDAFKRFLYRRNAVPLTIGRGGAWFIPAEHKDELEKIKKFYNEIADKYTTGDFRIRIRTIPMIDNFDVKEIIEESVKQKVEQEMQKLVEETIARLNSADDIDEILEKAFRSAIKKREDIMFVKKKYEAILKKRIEINKPKYEEIPMGAKIKAVIEKIAEVSS